MNNAVLLVSTATQYSGTVRMPATLANAGFEVSRLTPQRSLAAKSRHVRRCSSLPDNASPMQWLAAFARMLELVSPRLVVPCDDQSVRLLQSLVLSPPAALPAAAGLGLASLLRESLGDPEHYATSIDKLRLAPAAQALGVRGPPYDLVSSLQAVEAFAVTHGYPVVLKLGHGSAGEWVRIVRDRAELARSFSERLATGLRMTCTTLRRPRAAGRADPTRTIAYNRRLPMACKMHPGHHCAEPSFRRCAA